MEAGLVSEWHALFGDLTLWDFYVMNLKLKYDARVSAIVRRRQVIQQAAQKALNGTRRRR